VKKQKRREKEGAGKRERRVGRGNLRVREM